ncbi:MAG TPA: hypothetical protein VMI30_14525 [Stellaceae bacterium]|nr:hypothetical protein [Stellaceae bacterium]
MPQRLIFQRSMPMSMGVVLAAALGACSPLRITDDTDTVVTIRYDGVIDTLDDVTAAANKACATHGKIAKLRDTTTKAALERFAHFNCVKG